MFTKKVKKFDQIVGGVFNQGLSLSLVGNQPQVKTSYSLDTPQLDIIKS
jgi:hypothetical protein